MHEHKARLGWVLLIGVYWVIQVLYLISPVDLIPDLVPVVGLGDDVLGLLSALGVTAFGLYKAFGDKIALPGSSTSAPVLGDSPSLPDGFDGYTPRTEHEDYEPLTPDELKVL